MFGERYAGFTVKHFHEHLVRSHGFRWGYGVRIGKPGQGLALAPEPRHHARIAGQAGVQDLERHGRAALRAPAVDRPEPAGGDALLDQESIIEPGSEQRIGPAGAASAVGGACFERMRHRPRRNGRTPQSYS